MSQKQLTRTFPLTIVLVMVAGIVLDYYFTGFTWVGSNLKSLAIKISTIFYFSGAISLILYHSDNIRRKSARWTYSILVIGIIAIMVLLGNFGEGGMQSTLYSKLYLHFYIDVVKGMGMIGFAWAMVALKKTYRLTSLNGAFIVLGGLILLLGAAPYAETLGTKALFTWFVSNVYATNVKVFDLLGTIGAILLVIRTLAGFERSFMAEPESMTTEAAAPPE